MYLQIMNFKKICEVGFVTESGVIACRKGKSPTLLNYNIHGVSYIYVFVFLQHFAHIWLASTPLRREVEGTDTDLVSYLFTLSFPGITVSCGLAKHMSVVLLHGGWSGESGGLGRLLGIGRCRSFEA